MPVSYVKVLTKEKLKRRSQNVGTCNAASGESRSLQSNPSLTQIFALKLANQLNSESLNEQLKQLVAAGKLCEIPRLNNLSYIRLWSSLYIT